jgi:septal ring factor EnvC (AmiA/AmiB activator)
LQANKQSYAALVRFNYKHRNDANPPLYLVNKKDLQAAVLQKLYATRIHAFESGRITAIKQQRMSLGYVAKSLKDQQDTKLKFLAEQQQQKSQLTADKQLHDKQYKELESTEKTLRTNLLAKKAAAAKLNKQIEAVIRKEIESAKNKAHAESVAHNKSNLSHGHAVTNNATASPNSGVNYKAPSMTADMTRVATGFEAYKGRLAWPVHGSIVETFGTHQHPELKDVVTNNNGVDIGCSPGSSVSCLYEGTVVAVISNAGYQNAVLVQHGDFYTVYANLGSVSVAKGSKVTARQTIGSVYTQPDTHKSVLHLEIWKGINKLNPQLWLLP